jgi:predicted amidohydrolase YtcJ
MVDQLLYNANVYTLDPARPRVGAIAIRRGEIVATGTREELAPLAGPATCHTDLAGAVVLPGMVDAHIHWAWTALNMRHVDLMDVPSRAECVARVAEAARRARPGEWIRGFGWAQGLWNDTDGAFPSAADLDAVAPNNPVLMKSRSGHAGWVNTRAMELARINASTPDPEGGSIQRDCQGHPTGILFESAMELASAVCPAPTPSEIADCIEEAQKLAWRCGLTGLHDYDGPDCLAALQILRERGTLGLRVVKQINDPYIHHAHALGLRTGLGDAWIRLGGLKIFADGALGPLTAHMLEPYEEQPDNLGIVCMEKARIHELVLEATLKGFPATIHAIGDAAVRTVLDVYQDIRAREAAAGIPRHQRRHRIEHVQLIHPDDVGRLAELDVIASIQPIHATSDYPVADRYWGRRAALSYNARVQIDAGARVAFGSDSPVEPFAPLAGIHAAVTRRRADGSPGPAGWYPEARLTVDEAIRGYTEGPAWAGGMEHHTGRLTPGRLADLVALGRDPYSVDPNDLLHIPVLGTMVDGVWRHRASGFAGG